MARFFILQGPGGAVEKVPEKPPLIQVVMGPYAHFRRGMTLRGVVWTVIVLAATSVPFLGFAVWALAGAEATRAWYNHLLSQGWKLVGIEEDGVITPVDGQD